MFSLETWPPGPAVFGRQSRVMPHPAQFSGAETAGDNLGSFTCPAHLGEGILGQGHCLLVFQGHCLLVSQGHCLLVFHPSPRAPLEPPPLKAGQGGECQCGWVTALWVAFSSVSGLNGARCGGG